VWWHKARELLQSDLELEALRAAGAREWWVADGVAFPAAAYRRYIEELYRANALVRGEHHVAGRRVDLRAIVCPVLVVVGARDEICPPDAALALLHAVGSEDVMQLTVPGGHVDALIGPGAREALYPALTDWLRNKP
jgi:polyhydroxyalkanoate synthase